MMLIRRKQQGQSVIEFAALILFILITLVVFQKYIVRGFAGRWKGVGDAMGQGRIYDPNKTIECEYNKFFENNPGRWYNRACFEADCLDDCVLTTKTAKGCDTCLAQCASFYCSD